MKNSIVFGLIGAAIILLLLFTGTIGTWGCIGLTFLLVVIGQVWYSIEKKKEQQELASQHKAELSHLEGFSSTKKLVGPWGLIAIDDAIKQLAFKEGASSIKKYPYSDILGCEVVEDGETTYRKSGALGRVVVGGIIAGGAGAIVGGITAKGQENREVKTVDFKLLLRDTNNPSFRIRFFDAWEETARTKKSVKISDSVYGPILRQALDNLNTWKEVVEVIIDKEDRAAQTAPQSSSISDELVKLNDLRVKDVLTQEEFEHQKAKLLKS